MSNKIYVGNLSFSMREESLKDIFAAFGDVESCKLIIDRETGRSKGFGFVEMQTSEQAHEAITNLDGKEVEGRNLRVNEAKPQERSNRSQRW